MTTPYDYEGCYFRKTGEEEKKDIQFDDERKERFAQLLIKLIISLILDYNTCPGHRVRRGPECIRGR